MARRRASAASRPRPKADPPPASPAEPARPILTRTRLALAVALLLATQWALAVSSLLRENPTIDEVVHLPAGVSYWEQGTFRLYPHNPPLIKLLAALPVVWAAPETELLYNSPEAGWDEANKAAFAHIFMLLNARRLFELFQPARLLMPTFALLGGLVVFDWSRRLWGAWGGLLSLTLWAFCPNILAHCRLVTTDVGATVIGFAATYAFWHFLRRPTWGRALLAGLLLGIGQLSKFSLLLLYGLWPLLWLVHELTEGGPAGRWRRVGRSAVQGGAMVALSVLVINLGYGFEGTGKPLGRFNFTCDTLTSERDVPIPAARNGPDSSSPGLRRGVLQYRVNRFRGTPLAALPVPLPEYYVSGFDDQKLEAEGVPVRAFLFADDPAARSIPADEIAGYPVYLDGELSNESWWSYYLMTLVYKVPEGTWALVVLALAVIPIAPRARSSPADEAALWVVPAVVIVVMSFGTNIAIGLRYVLPIFPYVFVAAGRLAPWAAGLGSRARSAGVAAIGGGLAATIAAALLIHPHYLAYFNWASGGAKHGSEHLIDSNLDWGQDLVNLRRWLAENAPDEPVGIAYFGQINPQVFNLRERPPEDRLRPIDPAKGWEDPDPPLDWFLPPVLPGTLPERPGQDAGPPRPGLYAVSASLMRGLPWRVYAPDRWAPMSARKDAFRYFEHLEPIGHVGYSILLYRIDADDAARLARFWQPATVATGMTAPPPSAG